MNRNITNLGNELDNIKLCVFDMAGTTVNEDNLVYKTVRDSINKVLSNANLTSKQVDLNTCLEFGAGKEKRTAIRDILDQLNLPEADIESLTDEAFSIFKDILKTAYSADSLQEFEGMSAFFEKLKRSGRYVVLNTGYDANTANKILGILDWSENKQIDALITADDVSNGRPAPDMITLAMNRFNVTDANQVLKAGDSGIDIEEGKNANCGLNIAVLSGAQTESQLAKYSPDYILDNLTDLAEYIK